MTQQQQPAADISTVTPAQRAQILREELARLMAEWDSPGFDNIRDVMLEIELRIDELEGVTRPD